VATNSAIVNALITAARNDKKVTVFVEVKARFDEAANIKFADQMRSAGINVIAGIPGMKVHAKTALVLRKSSSKPGKTNGYAFVSTGNFNEKTARTYSDEGLFTSDKKIIDDLRKLFQYIESPEEKFDFKHILVPKFNFKPTFFELLEQEAQNARDGKVGRVILKMNGLQEQESIDQIYKAAEAGVETDLIIRGICCLRTNMPFSKGIRVTRIVDRFLEHARIFAFYNNGDWKVYISSADLMNRNLRRRVEAAIPIYYKEIKQEIIDLLEIQLNDNTKSRFLDKNIKNIKKEIVDNKKNCAQVDTFLYLEKKVLMGS